jgi:hypothetical protein
MLAPLSAQSCSRLWQPDVPRHRPLSPPALHLGSRSSAWHSEHRCWCRPIPTFDRGARPRGIGLKSSALALRNSSRQARRCASARTSRRTVSRLSRRSRRTTPSPLRRAISGPAASHGAFVGHLASSRVPSWTPPRVVSEKPAPVEIQTPDASDVERAGARSG